MAFHQRFETPRRLFSGDQTRIDCADRRANDPIGLDASLVQCLIDAYLVSTERTAALQNENDLGVCLISKGRNRR